MDLFERHNLTEGAPLADRMRPQQLEEVLGHAEALAPGSFLARAIEADSIPSLLLWGPPGSGKTTIARIVARYSQAHFEPFSAVLGGVKEVRAIIAEARRRRATHAQRTILFVDEIHRFNKGQQDAFLPHVEDGTVILIGATTENPSFQVNSALLSRCRTVRLEPLDAEALHAILARAAADERRGLGAEGFTFEEEALRHVARLADGDARRGLNLLEQLAVWCRTTGESTVTAETVGQVLSSQAGHYDRDGDEHYDIVSAFIKSMRGSDPDAAIYYMVRMLDSGEDPLFILRRMVIFAAEDVGNADPRALQVAVSALDAFRVIGLPEGAIPMAQACTYLASTVKSNAAYAALKAAREAVRRTGSLRTPLHLRNAPTALARSLGHAQGYQYPHDHPGHFVPDATYLPRELLGSSFYRPSDQGLEQRLGERLRRLQGMRDEALGGHDAPSKE